ncbi:MAG: peptidylprolyl isomerase [Gammaproteobacteria bacterium]|nr:peptidylprolyl isomerase [Gammaproteobacteria bacterium]
MRREIFIFALAAGLAQTAIAEPVAKVNGEEISQATLQMTIDATLQQTRGQASEATDSEHTKQVQQQVLDLLISQQLLWQEAKNKDLVAPDEEVDQALAQMKDRAKSEEEFKRRVEQSGVTVEAYREDLKRRLSVQRLVDEDITKDIAISDQEVDDFYNANTEQMKRPEEVHARHILIKVESGADEAADKAATEKIEEILVEAKGGADFAELAKKHSQGPSGPQGGDLGFFGRGRMVPAFEQAAFALQPGELSEAVRTQFGYHIIKSEERRGGDTVSKEDAAARIRAYLQRQKVQQGVQDLVQELRNKADIEILLGS